MRSAAGFCEAHTAHSMVRLPRGGVHAVARGNGVASMSGTSHRTQATYLQPCLRDLWLIAAELKPIVSNCSWILCNRKLALELCRLSPRLKDVRQEVSFGDVSNRVISALSRPWSACRLHSDSILSMIVETSASHSVRILCTAWRVRSPRPAAKDMSDDAMLATEAPRAELTSND